MLCWSSVASTGQEHFAVVKKVFVNLNCCELPEPHLLSPVFTAQVTVCYSYEYQYNNSV